MYGALPKEEQDRAIKKKDRSARRIIVSSPIAEASLTIEGVTCVVDSGFRRESRFSVNTGLPRLVTVRISQDSAIQRAGRAGRVEDGVCIRLFSEGEFTRMPQHSMPEILSTDLAPTALLLSDWGCSSLQEILNDVPFVDSPPCSPSIACSLCHQELFTLVLGDVHQHRLQCLPHHLVCFLILRYFCFILRLLHHFFNRLHSVNLC